MGYISWNNLIQAGLFSGWALRRVASPLWAYYLICNVRAMTVPLGSVMRWSWGWAAAFVSAHWRPDSSIAQSLFQWWNMPRHLE